MWKGGERRHVVPCAFLGRAQIGRTSLICQVAGQQRRPQRGGRVPWEVSVQCRGERVCLDFRLHDPWVSHAYLQYFLGNISIAVLCYDTTNVSSMSELIDFALPALFACASATVFVLGVGTKCDLLQEKQVDLDDAKLMLEERVKKLLADAEGEVPSIRYMGTMETSAHGATTKVLKETLIECAMINLRESEVPPE